MQPGNIEANDPSEHIRAEFSQCRAQALKMDASAREHQSVAQYHTAANLCIPESKRPTNKKGRRACCRATFSCGVELLHGLAARGFGVDGATCGVQIGPTATESIETRGR